MPIVVEKLRIKAQADYRARISIDKLDAAHRDVLIRAINNVLATENAIFTYAQIIDGLPIADVAWDQRIQCLFGDHPLDGGHEELCLGALDKAREVCPQWDPALLTFDPRVVNAFQRAAPGTRMFNTRLIEMVAVALHQFGVLLHQMDFRMHQGDIEYMINWTMPKPAYARDDWEPMKPLPSIFNHSFYRDFVIYPEGVADMVGYWAEDRILGGVVLFDRDAELDANGDIVREPPNVYLHPSRAKVTFRVTQLLDWQQQALIDFLLAEPEPAAAPADKNAPQVPCPLPILVDDRNRTRVDPHEALVIRGIYRDIWERKPLDRNEWQKMIRRPQGTVDYPEIGLEGLVFNKNAGVPLPEGKLKRYLEGRESVPEGPTKRLFDEYKEYIGREKRVKLDEDEEGDVTGEAKAEVKEGEKKEDGKDEMRQRDDDHQTDEQEGGGKGEEEVVKGKEENIEEKEESAEGNAKEAKTTS
ncbi:hypothetical protein QBC42DRAFT_172210 [Cladorrhinum samala]|uniref:Uncharacterized protein n=1 Tax=Cladorrhinum samala TaxID=585594 RepID=A0AAV9HTM2_9PEZI|nr:hypothetical protein QBC42DRAFT_172210 [Cladorrhinum samala]